MATREWLLLRLPATADAPLSWAAADASGRLLSVPSTDDGGSLHTLTTGRRLALLVPGSEVAQFQAALPAGNEARLLQLAPFALEDQVAQDVDELHFAVGVRDAASGLVPVAVTERSRMQHWMDQAAALQLLPEAVYAESDLAPVLPGHVTVMVTGEQLLLRHGEGRALQMPAADPALALEMLLGDPAQVSAVNLSVFSTPQEWPRHAAAIEALRPRVASFKVHLAAGGPLALYALGLAQSRPINLMQGAFRPQRPQSAGWRAWRGVAIAALALLVVHAGASWWQLRQLRVASRDMDASIARMYGSIFPGQAPGSAPRRTLERRLAELASGPGNQGGLLPPLAAVANAREGVPSVELLSFTFQTGRLQLRMAGPDAASLQQFSEALRGSGFDARVTAGNQQGGRFEGQVELVPAGT